MKTLTGLLLCIPAVGMAHGEHHVHPHGWDLQWVLWIAVIVLAVSFFRAKK